MGEIIAFYVIGGLIVLSASMVIFSRKPVHSAMFLIFCFVSIAALYITLHAEFIAAIQVLVYAGGIMVLFLFMVMLISMRKIEAMPRFHRQATAGVVLAIFVLCLIGVFLANSRFDAPAETVSALHLSRDSEGNVYEGNVSAVARELFQNYLFPFELASVYLLAAMIGAIVLARREQ